MDNNYLGYAERAIVTENAYNTAIGEIIEVGTHWTNGDSMVAIAEVNGNYSGDFITIFRCKNAEGHKVDYSKLDEYDEFDEVENFDAAYKEELSKFDCSISFGMDGESEVIIENAKFKVISIEDDELYGKRDEDGAPGIRIINVEMIK